MLLPSTNIKSIIVTGGAGFIGSHLIQHLLTKYPNYLIFNIDSLTYASDLDNCEKFNDKNNYQLIKCDINNKNKLEDVFKKITPYGVFHLAAESHVDNSIANPNLFIETNVLGTLNLLNLSLKYSVKRFLQVSTDEVYGSLSLNDEPSNEESPYKPRSPYSASKASSDHLVQSFFNTYGLNTVLTNCSNNFGPNQHNEKLIPTIIKSLVNKTNIPIYGDGENVRDWLYVKDHCEALDIVFHNGKSGEKYNIGGDNELTNMDLVKKICKLYDNMKNNNKDSTKLIKFIKDRAGHDFRYSINHNKITSELGWLPGVSFDMPLLSTIKHYIKKYE
tara:strand:- start:2069 stop:3064 length:996 start_codon:yes stop_codon:yes gene_type:complete